MNTLTEVRNLHLALMANLRQASEKRDVDALMAWYSKDAIFHDRDKFTIQQPVRGRATGANSSAMRGIQVQGWDNIHRFYTEAYKAMPFFEVEMIDLNGTTPEFCACEMRCTGRMGQGKSDGGLEEDVKVELIGVSLFTWRWQGTNAQWDGTSSPEVINEWKIVDERIYFTTAQ